jgi:diaminopimelate decarboxylase
MSPARPAGTRPGRTPGTRARGVPRPARNEILRDGRLGGHDPAALAGRDGTPFFAYDLDVVERQVTALRDVLPPAFDLAYAVKANPNLAIVHHLGRLGVGADVASGGELGHVRRAGIAPDRVVFTGPGKRDVELAAAVEAGVRAVTVESPGELRRLARIAEGLGRRQPVLLRAAIAEPVHEGRVQLLGDEVTGKFGMDDADLRVAAAEAVASAWLDPLGIHAFGVSNELDATVLGAHLNATIARARELADTAGFPLRLVDMGGGLGYPYDPGEAELDLRRLGSRLAAAAAALAATPATRQTRVVVEPGRFLVAAAGAYVARVVDRKTIRGRHVVILDGGIHHLLRHLLVGQKNRVRALTGAATTADGAGSPGHAVATAHDGPVGITIGGPLCTGLDVIARAAVMTPPDIGDLIAVLDVGAYGATESMPFFLSHPLPAELALLGGEAWVTRPRIEPETWLAWQEAAPVG